MHDVPDAATLRRRRLLVALLALGLLVFGTRTPWVQHLQDLAHGLYDGFVAGTGG
jgi:hypothetical protein